MVATSCLLSWFRKKRVQIGFVTLALFGINWTVLAESAVSLVTHYYAMKPGLTITKPIIYYENQLSLESTITAKFTVDRVVTDYENYDSLSGASQYTGNLKSNVDVRQEYVAGASQLLGDWKIDVAYLLSIEEDYESHAPSVGITKDFNQRNTSLTFGYAHNFDSVQGLYMSEAKDKDVDNFSLALSQVLSPRSIMQLGYTLQYNQGFLGTGNRQLILKNDLAYDEYLPANRVRQALGARLAYWLPSKTALHFSYRFYRDDWQLSSNTFGFKIYQNISRQWQVRGEARFYSQSEAGFIKSAYDGTERYLTSASSLKDFSSQLYGIRASYKAKFLRDSQFQLKYERYRQSTGLYGDILMFSAEMVY